MKKEKNQKRFKEGVLISRNMIEQMKQKTEGQNEMNPLQNEQL